MAANANEVTDSPTGFPTRTGAMAALEWIVARTMFPAVLGGSIFYAVNEIDAGTDPAQAIILPTLFSYLLIATVERVLYWQRAWLHSNGDLKVDLGHLLISGLLTTELLKIPIFLGSIALAAWLSNLTGTSIWPSEWSLWIQLPMALVFGEFFLYWIHRLTHEVDWLWRFHAMHHSAPRLYFLNAVRFHPVDIALSSFSPLVPLLLLGADARIISLFGLVSAVHGLFQHANIVLRLGPLNWIFSMAELHRWHHSRLLEESNTNFGQNLIVWDTVFGTRFLPKDREPPRDIGIAGLPSFPMDYLGQLMSPVHWGKIKEESAAMGAGPNLISKR
jgi:sterol desaturase/sphingolipid hydroxylase (fatty acid hydroxylase superfamily)